MAREVDRIKEKLDIVEVIRGYLPLQPAGKNFKALCPFHQERTPSFIVSPERRTWHCFGCGLGGDVISFVMRYENLEFPEALKFLGEKAGVAVEFLSPREQREFGILYDLHGAAKEFFRGELAKHAGAREYLAGRGLTPETIETFELGFSPGGEALTLHLIQKGFDVDDVLRAGLSVKTPSNLLRDRFQERIIFPLASSVGKVVAFTGRLLKGGGEVEAPKYLNSPESPIFNKSKILYGLHLTKGDIARERAALLVEGQMDFLGLWQAGIRNVVAVSGTALTAQHLERLRRLADTVVLSFDNDEAGLRALERGLDTFHPFDFHVRVLDLGSYKDPADAARANPAFLKDALAKAKPAFAHLFERYLSREALRLDVAAMKRVVRGLLGKVKRVRSPVEQTAWLKELARLSGISEVALMTELAMLPATSVAAGEAAVAEVVKGPARLDLLANRLAVIAFTDPSFLGTLKEKSAWLPETNREAVENPASEPGGAFQMQASYVAANAAPEVLALEFRELMRQLEIEVLRREQENVRWELHRAEAEGDDEAVKAAAARFHTLATRIDGLKR